MNKLKQYLDVQQGSADDLVLGHGALVQRIAHHLHARLPSSVQVDDLVQAGMVALIECARNYNSESGVPFEAFARLRVRGAMIDELRRGNWAPRSIHRKSRAISEAITRIENAGGDTSNERLIAKEADMSLEEYYHAVQDASSTQVLSLDEMPFQTQSSEENQHLAGPGDNLQKQQIIKMLAELLPRLGERDRLVITLYYHEELNQREIAVVLGVTESRVSQIHGQALLKMRGLMKADSLGRSNTLMNSNIRTALRSSAG